MTGPVTISTPVIVLVGPTAIGKTALSLRIAGRFNCAIVSMDSMQVYRYMDIGTAKPSGEEQGGIPHYLIDIVDPDQQYNAARFVHDCLQVIRSLEKEGTIPLVTGGTGLYLSALLNGLFDEIHVDPEVRSALRCQMMEKGTASLHQELAQVDPGAAARIHPNDQQRILRGLEIYRSTGRTWSEHLAEQEQRKPPVSFSRLLMLGLTCDRSLLRERIARRTLLMLEQGLVDEVAGLRDKGFSPQLPSMQAIGYRHANEYLDGTISKEQMTSDLIRDTRRYAKRQMTWFTRQHDLRWHERDRTEKVIDEIDLFLNTE